jgi:ATP phosphoribosyltransferase
VVGEDVLRESGCDVYEPLGLGLSRCRLVLAGPPEARERNLRMETNLRVATKYPRLALDYFQSRGISVEIMHLNGSIELAPAVGLADLLVDLVQTGRTLRENGLVVLEEIMQSQAMLIVNRASHKLRFAEVRALVEKIAAQVTPLAREEAIA